jgi:hypothetical protein
MHKFDDLILAGIGSTTFLALAFLAIFRAPGAVSVAGGTAALVSTVVGILAVRSSRAANKANHDRMLELEHDLVIERNESKALRASLANIEPPPPQNSDTHRAVCSLLTEARMRLPFAEKISASVPGKTEEATFVLIEKFSAIQNKSSQAATAAREARFFLDGSSSTMTADATTIRTREAIRSERLAINGIVHQNRENKKNLNAMSNELESGIELLHGIEEITERSKLIAFNMAIEAARIGEKGRGFKVIVGELHLLNERTADFSRRVAKLLGRFKEYTTILVTDMAERSEELLNNVELGMTTAEESVETLIEASTSIEKFTREISALAVEIDKDLNGVLESLQFQDMTSQMIEGAVKIIGEANHLLIEAENKIGEADLPDRAIQIKSFEALRQTLLDRSKTSGEKQAIAEVHL